MKKSLKLYSLKLSDPEDRVLYELRRKTNLEILMPRMMSGHFQGKLLEMLSKMINPSKILEIGTFTGYSAICLAKGLQVKGKLHTIEYNDELKFIIEKYIKKAKLENKIILYIGDALKKIKEIDEVFDLVFIDADKRQYLDYYHAIFAKVKKGGFIIVDNVFWNGKVVEKIDAKDTYTQGVVSFNNFIENDIRVEKVTLPIRDGLMILRKK